MARIGSSVTYGSAERVLVVEPQAVHMYESALPWTIEMVLQGRERNKWLGAHSTRLEANPVVRSSLDARKRTLS